MASSRMIREGLCDSERVAKLDWFAQALFFRLLLKADDFGFYDARPSYVRAQLFSMQLGTVREANVARALNDCEGAGLIRFYEVDGKRYLEILRYGQRCDTTNPKFPPPEGWVHPFGRVRKRRPRYQNDVSRSFPEVPGNYGLDGDGKKEINSFLHRSGCATADASLPASVSESVGGDDDEEWVDVFASNE